MRNKEKFLNLVSEEQSDTLEKAKKRKEFREMFPYFPKLTLLILKTMEDKGISEKKLSKVTEIPLCEIQLILSGKKIPFIEVIYLIEKALKVTFKDFQDCLFPCGYASNRFSCLSEFKNELKAFER